MKPGMENSVAAAARWGKEARLYLGRALDPAYHSRKAAAYTAVMAARKAAHFARLSLEEGEGTTREAQAA
jgi:hypothetical protein